MTQIDAGLIAEYLYRAHTTPKTLPESDPIWAWLTVTAWKLSMTVPSDVWRAIMQTAPLSHRAMTVPEISEAIWAVIARVRTHNGLGAELACQTDLVMHTPDAAAKAAVATADGSLVTFPGVHRAQPSTSPEEDRSPAQHPSGSPE